MNLRRRNNESGTALLTVLMLLAVAAALIYSFSRALMMQQARSSRVEAQDRIATTYDGLLLDLRNTVRDRITASLASGMPIDTADFTSQFSSPFYTVNVTVSRTDRATIVPVMPPTGFGVTLSQLTDLDDPFLQAPAIVLPLVASADASAATEIASDPLAGNNMVPIEARAQVNQRYLPASAWSYFAWGGDLVFNAGSIPADGGAAVDAGRLYSRFALRVDGGQLLSLKPLTTGGAVATGATGQIRVVPTFNGQAQGSSAELGANISTDTPQRIIQTVVAGKGAITTGEETSTALIRQANFARVFEDAPYTHAIHDNNGAIEWQAAEGYQVPSNTAAIAEFYPTSRHLTSRIIRIHVDQLTSDALRVTSTDPATIVLLAGAGTLPRRLSIVSSLPIYVAGAFNEATVVPASIVSARQIVTVPEWW